MKFITRQFKAGIALIASLHSVFAFVTPPVVVSSEPSKSALDVSTVPRNDGSGLSYGERSRPFRRNFYTQPDWEKHRSRNRFKGNLLSITRSGVIRQLTNEVLFITAAATAVWATNCLTAAGFDDLTGVHHEGLLPFFPTLQMPSEFFTFSSPALSLLLVFKTNTSYGRWDEARKAWGVIVNSSRTILRQGAAWLQETNIPERDKIRLIARLAAAVWCFPRSLTRHVLSAREDDAAYAEDCRANLRPDLAEDLIAARHKPTRATYEISCAINDLPLSDIQKATLEYSVNQLCDAMGANDRILSSPVPLVYTRHLARFLEVWLLMLPLGLWPDFTNSWNHIAMIPITVLLSYFLLGIEELGVQLEEPFSVLPLHKITSGIGLSAEEHVQWFLNDSAKSEMKTNSAGSASPNYQNLSP